jgi:7-cyano-7-deazaguanine synthase
MTASAVLFSGGLDSAVLLAMELRDRTEVWPVHIRAGLAWEDAEARAIERQLACPPFTEAARPDASGGRRLQRLSTLHVEMRDVYPPAHWAVEGRAPAFDTPDEDVYLEGRNVILLSKAAVFCSRHGLNCIAIGPLAGNPFPDATPAFFTAMAHALSLGLARPLSIVTPLATMHKDDVVRLGLELGVPLDLTLSCMNPQPASAAEDGSGRAGDLHCGQCSKCRERRDAFRDAGVDDPTAYAVTPVR